MQCHQVHEYLIVGINKEMHEIVWLSKEQATFVIVFVSKTNDTPIITQLKSSICESEVMLLNF